ncbi:MAG TPA: DUF2889 domain-containing protein [Bacillota bacterium]|nr:DUF2889 domain-containing protein [Bacillota bacterium]
MEIIFQRNWFSTVRGVHRRDLLAGTYLTGTDVEASGRLLIDRKTFVIKDACWEVYRSPGGKLNGINPVPRLKGVTAYFNAGGELRRSVGNAAGGLAREMLAECVRAVIQAETFVYGDRGYPTAEAYGEYWEKHYLNSCRYYSNLHRVSRKWSDYVGNYCRGENFFNRAKFCSIAKKPDGLKASGGLSDSFHEMGVSFVLDREGRVTRCTGNFLRAPDPVCFENGAFLERFTGVVLPGCGKKEIAGIVGGPGGCDHLVDLISDLGKAVRAAGGW